MGKEPGEAILKRALVVAGLILFAAVPLPLGEADGAPPALAQVATLPIGLKGSSMAWTGQELVLFGGSLGGTLSNKIFRINPETGAVTESAAHLPTARWLTSAVSDGSAVYVFGGRTSEGPSGFLDDIQKYVPSTDAIYAVTGTLGLGRSGMSSIWDGTNAYLFGGVTTLGFSNEILRFDPGTGLVSPMQSRLPTPRSSTAAVWDGSAAFIFGGTDWTVKYDDILRFTPSSDRLEAMSARLPARMSGAAAAWVGSNAYVFAGCLTINCLGDASTNLEQVVRYDSSQDEVEVMTARFGGGRYLPAAASSGDVAFVAGGAMGGPSSTVLKAILRYNPLLDSPSQESLRILDAKLPTPRRITGAATDGREVFIFGGTDQSEILRFAPEGPTVEILAEHLPLEAPVYAVVGDGTDYYVPYFRENHTIVRHSPGRHEVSSVATPEVGVRRAAAAVWDGSGILIFGGSPGDGEPTDEILRYDPTREELRAMNAHLPRGRFGATAIWDGQYAWLFGGAVSASEEGNASILRYDPATDTISVSESMLLAHHPVRWPTTVWDGQTVYIFGGGRGADENSDVILEFAPGSGGMTSAAFTLPRALEWASAALVDGRVYVFGGSTLPGFPEPASGNVDEILEYTPRRESSGAQAPQASFTVAVTDLSVELDGTGSGDSDGVVKTYYWNWGDDSRPVTGAKPSHTYASAGTYEIRLAVMDSQGLTAVEVQNVAVGPGARQSPPASSSSPSDAATRGTSPGVTVPLALLALLVAFVGSAALLRGRLSRK